jgi:hypothetical protein
MSLEGPALETLLSRKIRGSPRQTAGPKEIGALPLCSLDTYASMPPRQGVRHSPPGLALKWRVLLPICDVRCQSRTSRMKTWHLHYAPVPTGKWSIATQDIIVVLSRPFVTCLNGAPPVPSRLLPLSALVKAGERL